MKISKLRRVLSGLVGTRLIGLFSDNEQVPVDGTELRKASSVLLSFDTDETMLLEAVDIPHFYGEGDLDISFVDYRQSLLPSSFDIGQVMLWGYVPKGLRFFSTPNVVQLELVSQNGVILSIGFFMISENVPFLSTEEIAINKGTGMSQIDDSHLTLLANFKSS